MILNYNFENEYLGEDSIVVPVLIATFGELIGVDYIYIIDNYINNIIK